MSLVVCASLTLAQTAEKAGFSPRQNAKMEGIRSVVHLHKADPE